MVLTRTALDRSRLRPRRVAALAAAAAAYIGVNAALVAGPLADPGRVDIRLENPTDYDMTVLARSPDRAGHIVVATVRSGDEKLVQEVVDLGDQWVFDFRQAGVDAASRRAVASRPRRIRLDGHCAGVGARPHGRSGSAPSA